MAAKKPASTKKGKMILPGAAGPQRKHYCPEHGGEMVSVKVFGRKSMMYQCKAGCLLLKRDTILK